MTENKGDLISREALKKEMQKADIKANDYETLAKMYENCVDNAPTVESDNELKEKIESYKNAYKIMSDAFENEVRKNERPQGEWIPIRLLMEDNYHSRLSFRCNQCRYVEGYRAKYCAGCGAFMRAEDGG